MSARCHGWLGGNSSEGPRRLRAGAQDAGSGYVASRCRLQYLIVGNGELWDELERLIQGLEVGEHLRLLGAKTRREMSSCSDNHISSWRPAQPTNGDQDGPAHEKSAVLGFIKAADNEQDF
jgi:hypothetical protein